ncbi:hypothetical protein FB451DRAFT_1433419 [Mycena latifolia]|nr:hypothetical protein FB451DRAFT_1433419 [Mycena latifolia]
MPPSIVCRFPPEVRYIIFCFVFYSGPTLHLRWLRKSRARVMGVCSAWMNYILAEPIFWTSIFIQSVVRPLDESDHIVRGADLNESAQTSIVRSKKCPLLIHLYFTGTCASPPARYEPLDFIRPRIYFLIPVMDQVSHMSIETDHPIALGFLHSYFEDVKVPSLRSLTINTHLALHSPAYPNNLLNWFPDSHSGLEELRLNYARFPLDASSFRALRVLEIVAIPRPYMVDATDLAKVIRSAPLVTLVMSLLGCSFPTDDIMLPIHSTSFTTVKLSFGYDGSIARLASLFDFPALRTAYLDISYQVDIERAMLCGALFRSVERLYIRERPPFSRANNPVVDVSLLFTLFPAVTHLDLQHSYMMLKQLYECSLLTVVDGYTYTLPLLRRLDLGLDTTDNVRSLASLHMTSDASYCAIHSISLRYTTLPGPISQREHLDRRWLAQHVQEFQLIPL